MFKIHLQQHNRVFSSALVHTIAQVEKHWFRVSLLRLVRFYQAYGTLIVHCCHNTGGGQIMFQI